MTEAARLRLLRIALRITGFNFVFLIYPLVVYWPSAWAWHTGRSEYAEMILAIYATLGVFLFVAASNPSKFRSLISFTIWSSIVHGILMVIQALINPKYIHHIYGDALGLLLVAALFAYLDPSAIWLRPDENAA
jgi:hypothetical protein